MIREAHLWLPIWHQFTWLWGGEDQGGASGTGYLITSGPLGDLFIVGGVAAMTKHFNCQEPGCWRPGHAHPDHGLRVCRRHYHADVVPPKPD